MNKMNLGIISTCFFSVLSVQAFAQGNSGFFRPANVPSQFHAPELDRSVNAAVRLRSKDGSVCSAIQSSADGYVLTAAHCVAACLIEKHLAVKTSGKAGDTSQVKFLKRNPNVNCAKLEVEGYPGQAPKVIFTGRGFGGFDDRKILDIPKPIFQTMLATESDYAILKMETKQPKACIPLAKNQDLKVGDSIYAVGYPGPNMREGDLGSNGYSKYVSFGRIYPDENSNQYYQEQKFSSTMVDRANEYYGLPVWFLSSLDSFSGDSGAMVVNQDGELIGIHAAAAIPDENANRVRYLEGTAASVRISVVVDDLRSHLGDEVTRAVFNCPGSP